MMCVHLCHCLFIIYFGGVSNNNILLFNISSLSFLCSVYIFKLEVGKKNNFLPVFRTTVRRLDWLHLRNNTYTFKCKFVVGETVLFNARKILGIVEKEKAFLE